MLGVVKAYRMGIFYSKLDALTLLVEAKAALDGVDSDGDTAVAKALKMGEKENAEYLLSMGAPLGNTALLCAVQSFSRKKKAIIQFVLSHSPNLNDPSAVFRAAENNDLGVLTWISVG